MTGPPSLKYAFFLGIFSNVAINIIIYHDDSSGGRRELGRRLLQCLLSNMIIKKENSDSPAREHSITRNLFSWRILFLCLSQYRVLINIIGQ